MPIKLSDLLKPITEAFAGKPLTADDVKKLKVGDEIEFLQKGRNWPRRGKVNMTADEYGSFWADDEFGFSAHLNPTFDKIYLSESYTPASLGSQAAHENYPGDEPELSRLQVLGKIVYDLTNKLAAEPDRVHFYGPRIKENCLKLTQLLRDLR